MKKLIKSLKGRKKLDSLIVSVLILALLATSPAAASIISPQFTSYPEIGFASVQICSKALEVVCLKLTLASNESFDPLKEIGQYVDIAYMFGGIGAAILLGFIYNRLVSREIDFITNIRRAFYSFKIRKTKVNEEIVKAKTVQETAAQEVAVQEVAVQEVAVQEVAVQEVAVQEVAVKGEAVQEIIAKGEAIQEITVPEEIVKEKTIQKEIVKKKAIQEEVIQGKTVHEEVVQVRTVLPETVQEEVAAKILRLYIAVPILCIALAELLVFFNRLETAVWVHIGILFALSLSNIFIKDSQVHKVHLSLMLLPVLRIVNLSMPVFSEIRLYTFILYYTPLAIPVFAILINQGNSLKELGITKKHLLPYMVLAVPLSFLLGLGEYLTIRPGYLIPDLSFVNLLMLTIIMVCFVGLVEELIFRSILQSSLEQVLSVPEALLITSFLFGLMHSGYGTYYEMLYTGFVGLVIGFIFYKTRSLPFIAVIHGLVNVFLFGILPLHLIGLTWF